MEAPIMLVATIVAARWTVLAVPPMPSARLGMGCFGLVLMLVANLGSCFAFEAFQSETVSLGEIQC